MNVKFARYGSISSKSYNIKDFKSDFHKPPVKKGLYAFHYSHVEKFLAAWKYEGALPKIKYFYHHGEIWCHMIEAANILGATIQIKNAWVKIHTSDFLKVIQKQAAIDRLALVKDDLFGFNQCKDVILNPYALTSMDHLEVFIPNKIKESK